MSFQDSAVIFFIALLLFGPKKLPELARQLGKLMGEFRRASNDFRMQMEDELRISEQAERQKQIAAIEAAAPASTADLPATTTSSADLVETSEATPAPPTDVEIIPEHTIASDPAPLPPDRHRAEPAPPPPAPLPIATSGELSMMPPATGLPVGRTNSGVAQAFESIPQTPAAPDSETANHG